MFLVWQGIPQTFDAPSTVTTLQGGQQTIAIGPIASQEIIKELGNNGGGFMNANSAHPFENPTPLTNFVEMVLMFAIPFSLTYTFGRMAGNQRQGWTIFGAMAAVFLVGAVVAMHNEAAGNPLFPSAVDQALGNMEGKDVRFGSALGGLFAAITTSTSTGAINAWHDSFQPIAGLVPLFNMELGEITPGGIGAGLYGMLVIGAILSVFIAGLMVGRTPEYLGKKVEAFEMKMAMLVVLVLGFSILGFTALATATPEGLAGPLNPGPHGFSEILYAFSSQTGQQRLGLRRADRQHPLLQHHRRLRDAARPVRDDRADPGPRRVDGRQASRRPVARHVPDHRVPVQRPAHRRDHHRRRAHVLPGPGAGSDRRAAPPERRKGLRVMSLSRPLLSVDLGRGTRRFQRFVVGGGAKPSGEPPKPRGVLDPDLLRAALPQSVRKLDPRKLIRNPVMFVVEITAALVTIIAIANVTGIQPVTGPGRTRLPGPDRDLAVVHGPVRDVRRGRRRGAWPGPGRDAPQDPLGNDRPSPPSRRHARVGRLVRAPQGRHHRHRGGRDDPR